MMVQVMVVDDGVDDGPVLVGGTCGDDGDSNDDNDSGDGSDDDDGGDDVLTVIMVTQYQLMVPL